jgi:hypothetical protein
MSPTPSPGDENRSSFRNVVFFRIPDEGKVQKLTNPTQEVLVNFNFSLNHAMLKTIFTKTYMCVLADLVRKSLNIY